MVGFLAQENNPETLYNLNSKVEKKGSNYKKFPLQQVQFSS